MRRLVGHLKDEGMVSVAENEEARQSVNDSEQYFPLPTNAEQGRILDVLGHRQGVLVQGPPGTGKSHTIANLICHFLAIGKRVLVTSETPRALRVLKDKLPKEIQHLCVSLLGADTSSFSELESSVSEIRKRKARWVEESQEELTMQLQRELHQLRCEKARISRELREIRESETHEVQLGGHGYRGTATVIGRMVYQRRAQFSWLTLSEAAPDEPPISNQEALFILQTLRRIDTERARELARPIVSSADLPNPQAFTELIAAEHDAGMKAREYEKLWSDPSFKPLLNSSPTRRSDLRNALSLLIAVRAKIEVRTEPWALTALSEILSERESLWAVLAERTQEGLAGMRDHAARADGHQIHIAGEHDRLKVLADAREMHSHLRGGGKWGLLGFPGKVARGKTYLKKDVRVDGRSAESVGQLAELVRRLEVERKLRELWNQWRGFAQPISSSLETQSAELAEHLEVLDLAFDMLAHARDAVSILEADPKIDVPDWTSIRPKQLMQILDAVEAQVHLNDAKAQTDAAAHSLANACAQPNAHPINRELSNTLSARDLRRWEAALNTLYQLERDKDAFRNAESLLASLSGAEPALARCLKDTLDGDSWDERLSSIEDAWHWAAADRWISRAENRDYRLRLSKRFVEIETRIGEQLGTLATEKAWERFLTRLTPVERENLEAWQVAVQKIGRGTGKHAERYRREARAYMAECVASIPAWIVPRYRVAEVLEPEPELFDVVIVDEASQTGIDGLFLWYLGKQIVVVGDDQQISPAGIGIDAAALAALAALFLKGVPFPVALDATSSLYTNAQIRFSGKIVLQEHFRCMPEIIQFSNDLCYAPNGTPLIPLRTYPPGRLKPVVTRFVADGYQEGKSSYAINRREAESIVVQIVGCLEDKRYAGKTFGVISLLGEAQARLIYRMLFQSVGPKTMEERSLVCGDAYAFQGDERDIMFLSMVSAQNAAHIGVLATSAAKQRFNVAASRARDQLWLFHSVKSEDLSAKCMRRRLLEYCLNPRRETGIDYEDRFDSDFEREVCARVRARGFHVRTQVPAGDQSSHPFRIDLVVEGMQNSLAVECDGDTWHGPDRYEADDARQRQLERAEWKFFRLGSGSFYADPDRALEPLWEELERLGIRPGVDFTNVDSPPAPATLEPSALAPDVEADTSDDELPEPDTDAAMDEDELEQIAMNAGKLSALHRAEIDSQPSEGNPGIAISQPTAKSEPKKRAQTAKPQPSRRNKPAGGTPTAEREKPLQKLEVHVDDEVRRYVDNIPANEWFSLAGWAKQKGKLQPRQRSLVYSIGKYKSNEWSLSPKQYKAAANAHKAAAAEGFEPEPPNKGQTEMFE
jgi:very-short-patch-repair endonuclease